MVTTRMRGSSDAYGSWNIICMSRRFVRSFPLLILAMSSSLMTMEPDVGGSRATIILPVVVLPQPDSPTRPNVSPGRTSKDTSETACTAPTWRCRIAPLVTGNSLTRFFTTRNGLVPLGEVAAVDGVAGVTVIALERAPGQAGCQRRQGDDTRTDARARARRGSVPRYGISMCRICTALRTGMREAVP